MADGDVSSVVKENELKERPGGSVNLGRHEAQCSICCHPQRQEIEEAFVDWGSVGSIAFLCKVAATQSTGMLMPSDSSA